MQQNKKKKQRWILLFLILKWEIQVSKQVDLSSLLNTWNLQIS